MPKTPFTSKKKFSRLLHIVHFQMYRAMFSTVSLSTAVLFFLMWASSSHKELQRRSQEGDPPDCPRNGGYRPATDRELGVEGKMPSCFLPFCLGAGIWVLGWELSLPYPSQKGQLRGAHAPHLQSWMRTLLSHSMRNLGFGARQTKNQGQICNPMQVTKLL